MEAAKIPRWDAALLSGWRWAGHIARLAARDPTHFVSRLVLARCRIQTDCGLCCGPRGIRRGADSAARQWRPVARWEDPIQQTCDVCTTNFTCWRDRAEIKEGDSGSDIRPIAPALGAAPVPRSARSVDDGRHARGPRVRFNALFPTDHLQVYSFSCFSW